MIFILALLPLISFSGIIQDEVSTTEKARFSFRTVCSKMVRHESPLIEVVSANTLDCMGKKVEVALFCDKAMAQDPYYLRAYVDESKKEVVCHSGKKVILKFQCTKKSDRYLCERNAKKNCEHFKELLAKRLDIVHGSFTQSSKGIKEINCYFESLPLHEKKTEL